MNVIAPNLTALLGESVGAKLVTHAGGINNLSKLPSSTIQILGAEKALFRAIKKRGDTPKFGLLFNSTYISRTSLKHKGKISRMLANKCALACRLDNY
jgi:nucleolar protein 56